jgi:hypothetical protein
MAKSTKVNVAPLLEVWWIHSKIPDTTIVGPDTWDSMTMEERITWLGESHPFWLAAAVESPGKLPPVIERFPLINTTTYEVKKELDAFVDMERNAISNMKSELYSMPEFFGVSAPTPELLHVVMNHPDMKKRIDAEARKRVAPQFEVANKLSKEAWEQRNTLISLREMYTMCSCPAIIKDLIRQLAYDRWNHPEEIIGGMRELVQDFQPLVKQLKDLRKLVGPDGPAAIQDAVDAILNPETQS